MQVEHLLNHALPGMVTILREYGFLMVLAAVGIAAYLFFRNQEQGALERSLDEVGTQLLSVVGEGDAREAVAGLYERFKGKVLRREVTPEQVEQLAANIVNLRRSGEQLTAEEAEGVFEIVLGSDAEGASASSRDPVRTRREEGSRPDAPMASRQPGRAALTDSASAVHRPRELFIPIPPPKGRPGKTPTDPAQFEQLGERLQILVDLSDVLGQDQKASTPPPPEWKQLVDVRSLDGTRVVVDVQLKDALSKESPADVERLVRRLESARLLTWSEDIEDSRRRDVHERLKAAKREHELQGLLEEKEQAFQHELARLVRFRGLQAKGVAIPFDIDSLEAVVQRSIETMNKTAQARAATGGQPPYLP